MSALPQGLKRALPVVVPLLVLVGGAMAFVGFSSLEPARPPATVQDRRAPKVAVVPLERRTVTLDVSGHGTVRARDTIVLSAEVGGRVAFVHSGLRIGSFVPEGQLLVRLDGRERTLARRRAQADVQRAEAEVQRLLDSEPHLVRELELRTERAALTRAELKRQEDLLAAGTSSTGILDQARSAWVQEQTMLLNAQRTVDLLPHDVRRARALLETSRVALEQADDDLARLELRAPRAGQVRARDVELGTVVAPGTPLVALAEFGAYEVPVQLSHDDLVKLAKIPSAALPRGMPVPPARVGPSPAVVEWVGKSKLRWSGQVTRIESVDADTRTVPVIVEVRDPWAGILRGAEPLLIGAYCRVTLRGQTRTDAWVVPERALREGDVLYLLRAGKLAVVPVRLDHLLDGEAVVSADPPFAPGDQLVVSRLAYPVEGMRLSLEAAQ